MDRILVFVNGEIIEDGSLEKLATGITNKGDYFYNPLIAMGFTAASLLRYGIITAQGKTAINRNPNYLLKRQKWVSEKRALLNKPHHL